jgi:hypothetical protein
MHTQKMMAVLLAASLGAALTGCQRGSPDDARPQSRMESPTVQGMAPAAPTQDNPSPGTAGAKQGDEAANGRDNASTATAPAQPSDKGSSMASPYDDPTKSGEAAKSKSSS